MHIGEMSAGEATQQQQQQQQQQQKQQQQFVNMSSAKTMQQREVVSPMSNDSTSGDCSAFDPDFDLSPLIKEELRTTIRNRRINSGKSDDLSYYDSPKPVYKLTKEEEAKRFVRRERNRIAAAKCRMKRKHETVGLSEESEQLQTSNARLREEIERLQNEKKTLLDLMNAHRPSCIMKVGRGPDVAQNPPMIHSVR